jgi:hypothetical protein
VAGAVLPVPDVFARLSNAQALHGAEPRPCPLLVVGGNPRQRPLRFRARQGDEVGRAHHAPAWPYFAPPGYSRW